MKVAANETERVAIVDSHGEEPLHPHYREVLSHVTFHGATPDSLRGTPVHGHGTWCGSDFFTQSRKPVECLFIRVFDRNGRGSGDTQKFTNDRLKEFNPHRINNSWGAPAPYPQNWMDAYFDAIGDATVVFAAGNDGRNDQSYPQFQLVDNPQIKIIAAIDYRGVRASFSSTGRPGERYADVAYLGEGSMSLDGRNGKVVTWNGTSSASPHGGGDLWANDIDWTQADAYWRNLALQDLNENGIPDGIHPDFAQLIREGGFHPDIGIGIGEIGRQSNLIKTGLSFGTVLAGGADAPMLQMIPAAQYLDFDLIDAA